MLSIVYPIIPSTKRFEGLEIERTIHGMQTYVQVYALLHSEHWQPHGPLAYETTQMKGQRPGR